MLYRVCGLAVCALIIAALGLAAPPLLRVADEGQAGRGMVATAHVPVNATLLAVPLHESLWMGSLLGLATARVLYAYF